jgi:hypothetical protein
LHVAFVDGREGSLAFGLPAGPIRMFDSRLAARPCDLFLTRCALSIGASALLGLNLPLLLTLAVSAPHALFFAHSPFEVALLGAQPIALSVALACLAPVVAGVRAAPLTLHPGRDRALLGLRLPVDSARRRRDDTRRKIIAGALLLDAVDADRTAEKPTGIARWWDAKLLELKRPQDRALFELIPPGESAASIA